MPDSGADFFISYHETDRAWAEWIADQLSKAGYSTWLKSRDSRPGANMLVEKQSALRTSRCIIAVLSPIYLNDAEVTPEWTIAFGNQKLLPVRVHECEPSGILGEIVPIDLLELNERDARTALISGVRHGRVMPVRAPLFPGKTSPIWKIPEDNSFFIGHEEDLNLLHITFTQDQSELIIKQVLNGLGGIGKTQIAIKYAHFYRTEYKIALWINCYTDETLVSDFMTIASDIAGINVLNFPAEERQHEAIKAVLDWLKNRTDWLLIFDNVETPEMVRSYIPTEGKGHILLTTRTQIIGDTSQSIEINKLKPEDGALLLLHRARIAFSIAAATDTPSKDYEIAMKISRLMDGHPLALDQAGAYIEETACGLSGYLTSYEEQRVKLLERRGVFPFQHPEPVATTWLISFESVKQINQTAYDLLQLCAFLYPDAIPEEIIIKGAPDIGRDLNDAIAVLRKFSLINRDPSTNTLTIHCLVQTVLRDQMDDTVQQYWAEQAVQCVQQIFSSNASPSWEDCQRYFSHIQTCAAYIDELNITFTEAGKLLYLAGCHLGHHLHEPARHRLAEPLLTHLRSIWKTKATLRRELPLVLQVLEDYMILLRQINQDTYADQLAQRYEVVQTRHLAKNEPDHEGT